MNDDRIEQLENEIAVLRADIEFLKGVIKRDVANNTEHFKYIYKATGNMWDALAPVLYKVMPEFAKTRAQMDVIFKFPNLGSPNRDKA